ncbi:hypothetical protein SEA_HANK144_39 [Streptomyces phage Hank144]|uniref:Uncharacterized protein n=1 Tax=Streptomyces phage Hank144 TaxID=2301573 RepID=A0A385DP60_9CAUD|nr:hypothetical protein KGG76_gp39 [Streptomyces phage Hank144]AXQ61094.1 hypothetical protein SEA_HANK144_39 [Streptomyces phage Hank144]
MSEDEFYAFLAWLADPESDPALVLAVEERYGVRL